MGRLRELYRKEVIPALQKRFGYTNVMQAPKIEKIVISVGVGEATNNPKALDAAVNDLGVITGQRPAICRAAKSVAAFKLRAGMPIGTRATLRGDRMYDFLERLISLALPRVRDFKGISPNSFDGRGNFSMGLREQLVFPEIDYDRIDKIRGMDVTIVTTAMTDEEARELLRLMGLPFRGQGQRGG